MNEINKPYWGAIVNEENYILYVFENITYGNKGKVSLSIDDFGSCTCFVVKGTAFIDINGKALPIYENFAFNTANGFDLLLSSDCCLIVIQKKWTFKHALSFTLTHVCKDETKLNNGKYVIQKSDKTTQYMGYSFAFVIEGENQFELLNDNTITIEGAHKVLLIV